MGVLDFLLRGKKKQKVLLLGLDSCGRTTALYKWLLGTIVGAVPTIGFNVETIRLSKSMEANIWEVGGCSKIKNFWKHYFGGTDICFFFWALKSYPREEVLEHLGELLQEEELMGKPILLVLSKSDESSEDELRQAKREFFSLIDHHNRISGVQRDVEAVELSTSMTKEQFDEPLRKAAVMLEREEKKPAKDTKLKGSRNDRPAKQPQEESQKKDRTSDLLEKWLIECDNDESDEEFMDKLRNFTLQSWDHRTHLRLAWILLSREERRVAKDQIFELIEAFIKNSPIASKTKFHLTMTYFWIQMVHYCMVATENPDTTFKGEGFIQKGNKRIFVS